jgi:hypothetical protein
MSAATPARLHFAQILQALEEEFRQRPLEELDVRLLLSVLQQRFACSESELLERGFRKAYRQLVEGV